MQFPQTFADLLGWLTGVVGLSMAVVAIGEALWRFWPNVPGSWRQVIMCALPFVLAIGAYFAQVALGQNVLGVEPLYAVIVVAAQVAIGGQLLFAPAKGLIQNLRPAGEKHGPETPSVEVPPGEPPAGATHYPWAPTATPIRNKDE